jgi:hypothetical protein
MLGMTAYGKSDVTLRACKNKRFSQEIASGVVAKFPRQARVWRVLTSTLITMWGGHIHDASATQPSFRCLRSLTWT